MQNTLPVEKLVPLSRKESGAFLLILCGISGSGKSTLALPLATALRAVHIDVDCFYRKNKPYILLGEKLEQNWDTEEALDLEACYREIERHSCVVFSTFLFTEEMRIRFPFAKIILLSTGSTKEEIISRCAAARCKSKGFSRSRALRDALMVTEVIYPFYLKTLEILATLPKQTLLVYKGERRRSMADLLAEALQGAK